MLKQKIAPMRTTLQPGLMMKIERRALADSSDLLMSQARRLETPRAERATPERLGKGQDARIQENVQRLVGGVASLTGSDDVARPTTSAAERWYRDYVMGVIGARDPEARGSGRAPDIHASMLARAAAIARCRTVREGLGLCSEIRLKLLLVDELSFSVIAEKLLPGDSNGRKKIAAQMAFLLEQLAEQYASIDRRRTNRRQAHPID
ncbi:hypothetical protein HN018_10885 [Lichenicola cladoniae]|uniref:Uncharacterized protein n=1 Tax=Lichenicola cladoniae TaxID=1484109 RepID=A0A6M8HPS6_9PROT|nr:hypothetical protein [Lichenicola cladoniae]NPD67872.1 hypothetical protein [Acetobacteraceae bacterium]QKE90473.1 hypothetical protein HN018_10885 [Lichenicola cladoniae]